jgi:5-bromo-4-chloroindolyl phosphate hydrolysis protein
MDKEIKTTEAQNTSLIGIGKDVAYIQKDISEIKMGIKELSGIYATKISVDDINKAVEIRLTRIEASSNLWKWLSPSVAAVLGSVLTFLTIQYLSKGT